jgi:Cys-rich repeat protein
VPRTIATILGLALACSIGASCGDDKTTPATGDNGGTGGTPVAGKGGANAAGANAAGASAAGSGADDVDLYGSFNVSFVPADPDTMSEARTSIIGKVNDGPTPSPEVWTVENEANGCKLYLPKRVLCQPACGSAAACVGDGMCMPYPMATSVGTATLTGVGATPIAMDPIANNYQPKSSSSVPYPPCSEGDTLMLAAAGGGHAGFEISAKCIAPLTFAGPYTLQKDQALKLTWSAPGRADLATIGVKLDISHHGGSTGKVECEVADTGSLEVPAAFITRLLELGAAGFPTVSVTRKVVGAGSGKAKNVALTVAASVEQPVMIPGLVSCSEDTDCPSGQTCQTNRSCK